MQTRRSFLSTAALTAGVSGIAWLTPGRAAAVAAELATHPGTPEEGAADEACWFEVPQAGTAG